MAAYPIASEQSLRQALVSLEPGQRSNHQVAHWRNAEKSFVQRFPSISVDYLTHLRDSIWFSEQGGDEFSDDLIPLDLYVKKIAHKYLSLSGGIPAPKGDCLREARRNWRWLSFSLPPDLLIAALPGARTIEVNTISTSLNRLLQDHGMAETHLHIGASPSFSEVWIGALLSLAHCDSHGSEFKAIGADFNDGKHFGDWLIRAAMGRLLLAEFLSVASVSDFQNFLRKKASLFTFCQEATINQAILSDLRQGFLTDWPPYSVLWGVYRELIRCHSPICTSEIPIGEANKFDPISQFYCWKGDLTPEVQFLRNGLRYLAECRQAQKRDRVFEETYWQIVRLRNLFYRHITQRPMTSGLQWFIRFYGRLKTSRKTFNKPSIISSALRVCGVSHGLRSLEVRTAPDSDWGDNLALVEGYYDAATRCKTPEGIEIAVVFHFTKSRSKDSSRQGSHGIGAFADPGYKENFGVRFGSFYRAKLSEAFGISRIFVHHPESLEVLRGIDVCTDELGAPNWVFVPLFRYLSETATMAAKHRGQPRTPLFKTVHAGEDFIHLLGGLRRVDETVRYLRLSSGDRIGHGVALGIDCRNWACSVGPLLLSTEERLLDLLWAWRFSLETNCDLTPLQWETMKSEIQRLSRRMFDGDYSIQTLLSFVDLLHSEDALRAVGFPHRIFQDYSSELDLLARYLSEPEVYRKGQVLETIRAHKEISMLQCLQRNLRKKLGSMAISVEVNPTSNLLIGNFADLVHHHFWRLNSPFTGSPEPPVTVVVGSDDPVTFASRLPEEYQLLADALMDGGCTIEEASVWIDRIRANSLRERFSLTSSADGNWCKGAPCFSLPDVEPPPG